MLAVENCGGELWLVSYDSPAHSGSIMLARFPHERAAEIYKQELARSMAYAREVGRGGLG